MAVADELSFAKAAKKSFVSQPTLSMQIKKLEEELGVVFFERTNKKVMVTRTGFEIIERARKIVRESDELREAAKNSRDPFSGNLRFGIFPTLGPYLLPHIMPPIKKAFPKIKLFLVEKKTPEILKDLETGELDAALLALPIEEKNLDYIEVFTEAFFLAAAKNHPLAKLNSITNSDLRNEKLLLLEDGHCLRSQALEVCDMVGALESEEFKATSLETLRHMVASGSGITLIPKLAIKKNDGIKYIPFSKNPPARRIALVFRKTCSRKMLYERISEIVKNF